MIKHIFCDFFIIFNRFRNITGKVLQILETVYEIFFANLYTETSFSIFLCYLQKIRIIENINFLLQGALKISWDMITIC